MLQRSFKWGFWGVLVVGGCCFAASPASTGAAGPIADVSANQSISIGTSKLPYRISWASFALTDESGKVRA